MDEKLYKKTIAELDTLIKGYDFIHVISLIAYEDFFISTSKPSSETLNENEFLFVMGLWIKNIHKECSINNIDDVCNISQQVRALMEQLHKAFLHIPQIQKIETDSIEKPFINFDGDCLKEIIYYAGSGAYDLQMIQFIEPKYRNDRGWIIANKNVDIRVFQPFFIDVKKIMIKHVDHLLRSAQRGVRRNSISAPDLFTINVSSLIRINPQYAHIINEFSFPIIQPISIDINDIGNYNPLSSKPIIRLDDNHLFIPNLPLLAIALYETPYYWIREDIDYYEHYGKNNRGTAAEEITYNLLTRVFSKENTYKNIEIRKSSKAVLAEIDVLVIYDDIAIIVQVKSKRLTEKARKGDETAIQRDFMQAVKKAYEQAEQSEKAILNNDNKYYCEGTQITVANINTCIKLCVTLDYFPAVDNIAKRELGITPQLLALSIFDLDMLTSYIREASELCEYFKYRCTHRESIYLDNEADYLGFYLMNNGINNCDNKYKRMYLAGTAATIDRLMYRDLMKKYLPQFAPPEYAKNSKIGRNSPCPCGSGKKYKKCCGI